MITLLDPGRSAGGWTLVLAGWLGPVVVLTGLALAWNGLLALLAAAGLLAGAVSIGWGVRPDQRERSTNASSMARSTPPTVACTICMSLMTSVVGNTSTP